MEYAAVRGRAVASGLSTVALQRLAPARPAGPAASLWEASAPASGSAAEPPVTSSYDDVMPIAAEGRPAEISERAAGSLTDVEDGESVPVPEPNRAEAGRRRKKPQTEQELLKFPVPLRQGYTLPPLSLLDTYPSGMARPGRVDPQDVARNLERALASFGVEARVVRWETGPVVTRFELQPAPGVKVQKITSLQNDIALALAASSVRLEAPIPGKAAIGVELPNERPGLVHLREILMSAELQQASSPLTVSVGKGIAGHPITADLVAMPHLLIAGATGAGKSVALNAMIATLLFRSTPEQVRFLMIDPKRVELTSYNGIPHLLSPVVTGPREAAAKLRWAIQEMESRYALFAGEGVRNIQAFNAQHPDRPLAYIVIIIDELADLMMVAPKDFEEIICRLAQMTRAVGIHLVVATQRPSVDVITGLIKANIPSRIAFAVSSQVDSRTILDHPGAERLLGRGDMLFAPIGATRPMRVQGSYISDVESERLVEFWRAQGQPEFVEDLIKAGQDAPIEAEGDDSLLADAARLVVGAGYGSVSLLQRKMRIGYVRAARLVDQLEEKGIVGPSQGSSPREVLAGINELERILRGGRAEPAGDSRPPTKAGSTPAEA
jgi:S-DNA-T family DNA segregation ATPase FtsK/SpoIIIE